MKLDLNIKFKVLFLTGLVLLFVSLFLDWYYFQVYNVSQELIASWGYNPITEWSSALSESDNLNESVKPKSLSLPLVINVAFIIVLVISAYTILFKDIEQYKMVLEKLYPYAYINLFLVLLNCYYIFVFPVFYLVQNDLYFPFLLIKDKDLALISYYCIGPGYILQVVSFALIFPYSIFYYKTIENFKSKEHSPKKFVEKYIRSVQEPLDLDKFIAQEKLKLKFSDFSFESVDDLYYNGKTINKK